MIIIGLTGSIGMGKSTVAKMFREAGVPVFDADAEVHKLQGPGGLLVAAIEAIWPGTTGPRGVDRQLLGQRVLGDRAQLTQLERLVLPAVAAAQRRFLRRHRARKLVVLDIPLLFEKRGWRRVDVVVVVSASAGQQRRRVLARPGMTPQRFAAILRLQTPDRTKRRHADFVIDTGATRTETRAQLHALVALLRAAPGRYKRRCARSFSIPRRRA
ncbi:MAG: dephospho-CoA kinase [Sphingomonadaceae bacterium]|nr:dephospho-CoA kinase [Sphingomonadaceae bacterium]